ncbi:MULTISPECIES: sensor histidine kinase KdpD [unclassified Serratia (in: enterobacteria)]|uniref:sensor histidine kinase n=1 Tax=unclassified Serratia (in: enterobacteria) TaxID=2647522 RepID=UPI0004686436|nr:MULTISPECIES: HAMP domain-containing sensor histidine kinase [unclassified Serratia (in: enterobacteria)]
MSQRTSRSLTIFIIITVAIFSLIAYLGVRTLEHEVLLRHYQSQTMAQTRVTQASTSIMDILRQKATRLDVITDYLQPNDRALKELVEKDSDIDGVFVLQKNRLLYPNSNGSLSQKELAWVQAITPLVNDPSLLYGHNIKSEMAIPQSGWFITGEVQEPLLIYWRTIGSDTIGFRVPYIKLLSDVINATSFDFGSDTLVLEENGRLLYQSNPYVALDSQQPLAEQSLPYPLTGWQVSYYGKPASTTAVYLWGGAFILLMLAIMGLIIFRLYREYTQTARLARQQVGFVSQVSHELKTPLTNISLYAELLKEELDEQHDEGQRYLDVIIGESQRLSRLIQNILSFTREPKLHLQPIDLNPLLVNITQTFVPSYQAKGMALSLSLGENVVVSSDIDRLTQIINNLLSNAEKYATVGKQVDVQVVCSADSVDIHVRDYGAGISEKELKMIFLPFYRVKSGITEGVAGTGIGLTIAQQLAHSLGGEILVAPQSPGVRFTLRLVRTVAGQRMDTST